MHTVKLYDEDDVLVDTAEFNTLGEACDYADEHFIDHHIEINNVPYDIFDEYDFDLDSLMCDCPIDDA
jgi:hypothetical protein